MNVLRFSGQDRLGSQDERQTEIESSINNLKVQLESGQLVSHENKRLISNKRWLHPEAKSLIEQGDFLNLDSGTKFNSTIYMRVLSEEKGFNPIIENSATVSTYGYYIGCTVAKKHWENPPAHF